MKWILRAALSLVLLSGCDVTSNKSDWEAPGGPEEEAEVEALLAAVRDQGDPTTIEETMRQYRAQAPMDNAVSIIWDAHAVLSPPTEEEASSLPVRIVYVRRPLSAMMTKSNGPLTASGSVSMAPWTSATSRRSTAACSRCRARSNIGTDASTPITR